MDAPKNTRIESGSRDLVITRVFDAPVRLVWRAWSEPEHFMRWWGPEGFTCPVCRMDFRAGGKYLWCMRSPEGRDYWTTGAFKEIVPLKRIVYTDSFSDEKGNIQPASAHGLSGEWKDEMLVTVTFEERAGKTTMILRHADLPEGEVKDMTGVGWNGSFDKLAESLK